MLDDELQRRVGFEDPLAGDEPIRDAAQRVDVRAAVDDAASERQLRRQIGGRSGDRALAGEAPVLPLRRPGRLDQPEVEHLHEVALAASSAGVDVGGLDVAVDEPGVVRVLQGVAHLQQEVHGPLGRDGTEPAHELLQVQSVEQLHDVIEGPARRDAEVVELHRVGRVERGRGLRLPLEPLEKRLGPGAVLDAQHLRPDQLDRGRPGQHVVAGLPDLAHAAVSQLLYQLVAAHPARRLRLRAEGPDHDQRDQREDGGDATLEEVEGDHVCRWDRVAEAHAHQEGQEPGGGGEEAGHQGLRGRDRHHQREYDDPHAHPGDLVQGPAHRVGGHVVLQRDPEGDEHLVGEADLDEPRRRDAMLFAEPHDHRRDHDHHHADRVVEPRVRHRVESPGTQRAVQQDRARDDRAKGARVALQPPRGFLMEVGLQAARREEGGSRPRAAVPPRGRGKAVGRQRGALEQAARAVGGAQHRARFRDEARIVRADARQHRVHPFRRGVHRGLDRHAQPLPALRSHRARARGASTQMRRCSHRRAEVQARLTDEAEVPESSAISSKVKPPK